MHIERIRFGGGRIFLSVKAGNIYTSPVQISKCWLQCVHRVVCGSIYKVYSKLSRIPNRTKQHIQSIFIKTQPVHLFIWSTSKRKWSISTAQLLRTSHPYLSSRLDEIVFKIRHPTHIIIQLTTNVMNRWVPKLQCFSDHLTHEQLQ